MIRQFNEKVANGDGRNHHKNRGGYGRHHFFAPDKENNDGL